MHIVYREILGIAFKEDIYPYKRRAEMLINADCSKEVSTQLLSIKL